MKKMNGIAILLFAILLQLCSTDLEVVALIIGVAGLIIAIAEDIKKLF